MHTKIHQKIKKTLGTAVALHAMQEKIKRPDYTNLDVSLLSLVKIVAKSADCDVVAFALVDFSFKTATLLDSNLLLDLVSKDCASPSWEERKNRHLSDFKADLVTKVLPLTNKTNISNVEIMADCFRRAVEPIFIKADKKIIQVREGWRWLPSKIAKTSWYHEGVTKVIHDEEDIAFVMLSTIVLTPKNTNLKQRVFTQSSPSASRPNLGISWGY